MTTPFTSPDRKVTCWRCGMRLPECEAIVEHFPREGRNAHATCAGFKSRDSGGAA